MPLKLIYNKNLCLNDKKCIFDHCSKVRTKIKAFFMPNFSKLPRMTFWPFIVKNMNVNMGAISKSLPQSNVCLTQPQILDLDQNVTITLTLFQKRFVWQIVILWPLAQAGNTNWKGELSTVDLLNKVACFVRKQIMFSTSKAADLN